MSDKPKIVVLCGSSRFVDVMAVCAWLIERDERDEGAMTMGLHLLPVWYAKDIPDHLAEIEGVANAMDELHLRKIDLADEIFVVNRGDYIGESTAREIEYAKVFGKKIRWYTQDPVGAAVEKIIAKFLKKEERDPEAPCDAFDSSPSARGDDPYCETDGHYRCVECKWNIRWETEERPEVK